MPTTPTSIWEQFAEDAVGRDVNDYYTIDPLRSVRSKRDASRQGRGFNINDFRSYRDHVGLIQSHDYHITIPFPPAMFRTTPQLAAQRHIELACESINFPSTRATIFATHRYSYGPMESRPTFPAFNPLQATFVTDRRTTLWKFFHDWLQIVVNFEFRDSIVTEAAGVYSSGQFGGTTTAPYEIGYKEEYAVDLYLYIYDPHGTLVRLVRFRQAFPIEVADVPLAWGKQNDYVKVPVAFAFTDWTEVDPAQYS